MWCVRHGGRRCACKLPDEVISFLCRLPYAALIATSSDPYETGQTNLDRVFNLGQVALYRGGCFFQTCEHFVPAVEETEARNSGSWARSLRRTSTATRLPSISTRRPSRSSLAVRTSIGWKLI